MHSQEDAVEGGTKASCRLLATVLVAGLGEPFGLLPAKDIQRVSGMMGMMGWSTEWFCLLVASLIDLIKIIPETNERTLRENRARCVHWTDGTWSRWTDNSTPTPSSWSMWPRTRSISSGRAPRTRRAFGWTCCTTSSRGHAPLSHAQFQLTSCPSSSDCDDEFTN